jgi:Alcohol dehydrogenase GroES-associated
MKAVVSKGPKQVAAQTVEDPRIEPSTSARLAPSKSSCIRSEMQARQSSYRFNSSASSLSMLSASGSSHPQSVQQKAC